MLLVRGAAAGAAATVPMSLAMGAAHRLSALGKAPPRQITERLLLGLGRWPRRGRRRAASLANHFAFGAAAGALAAPVLTRLRARPARLATAALYGAAIWAGMYGYALPALGLMARPARDRGDRQATMLAAHLIYGAALGALL
jgi:hypothetical protein